jgi:hypothetical protein
LGDNIDSKKKTTESLFDGSKEVGLEVNIEQTKYKLLSRQQNAGQNHDIKIGNRCFESVAQFKYLEMTVTNQNLVQAQIKMRLSSGNAHLLPKNVKIRIKYNFACRFAWV